MATVLALFREVLGAPDLTGSDDFFELGGHSLLGMQLVNRVQETLAAEVELFDLFDAPTAVEFAQIVHASIAVDRTR